MSEASGGAPIPWHLKIESDDGQGADVRQLSEVELQRELRSAGSRLSKMRVKQGNSAWYPADEVLQKFRRLASEGIYVRHDGKVKGPFTAIKAVEILEEESDLDRTQAKVGIHADWIPAIPLLQKLRSVKEGTDRPLPTDGAVRTTQSTTDSTEATPAGIAKTPSRPPEQAGPARGAVEPAIELVMVAEPVQSQPTRPAPVSAPVVHRPSVHQPRAAAPMQSPHHRVTVNDQQTSQRDPIMVWAGVLGVLAVLLVVGLAISVIVHNWPDAVAVGDADAAMESRSAVGDLPPVNAAPPVSLCRPSTLRRRSSARGCCFAPRLRPRSVKPREEPCLRPASVGPIAWCCWGRRICWGPPRVCHANFAAPKS